jgi:hypothetical protein
MAHASPEDLMKRFLAIQEAGDIRRPSPEQLRLLRELIRDCPAFTPALLQLSRLLQLAEEPGVDAEAAFAEAQRLLEQAVLLSRREAPTLIELGYFLDVIRNREAEALALWEEGASQSLKTLEDAWVGMLRTWAGQRTRESLEKGLRLASVAERVFPESLRLLAEVDTVRAYARQDGVSGPGG